MGCPSVRTVAHMHLPQLQIPLPPAIHKVFLIVRGYSVQEADPQTSNATGFCRLQVPTGNMQLTYKFDMLFPVIEFRQTSNIVHYVVGNGINLTDVKQIDRQGHANVVTSLHLFESLTKLCRH